MESRPGTVERYLEHERCHQHIAKLTVAIEKIAAICNGRDHARIEPDGLIKPNGYMQIHLIARGAVPK